MKLSLVMRGGMQVSMERDLHISSPLRMASHLGGEREKQKSFQTSIHPPSQFLYCPAGVCVYMYMYIYLYIYIFLPEKLPTTSMDTLWKEVTPSALQWENPQEAEYSQT